jgi:hypothetical protein
MYVLAKIFVRPDMKSNEIKCKIVRKKHIHKHFNFKCVLTFASFFVCKKCS